MRELDSEVLRLLREQITAHINEIFQLRAEDLERLRQSSGCSRVDSSTGSAWDMSGISYGYVHIYSRGLQSLDPLKNPYEHWCAEHGYTDAFYQEGQWWAFAPNAVMPVPLKEVVQLK